MAPHWRHLRQRHRLAVNLQPVTVVSRTCPFRRDSRGLAWLWLTNVTVNRDNKTVTPGKEKVAGLAFDPNGKVGGALDLEKPEERWPRALLAYAQWRGISTAF
jgi:hypothetical protein